MSRRTVRIGFAGDLLYGGQWPQLQRKRNLPDLYPFTDVIAELENLDLFVVNLEGPLTRNLAARQGATVLLANEPAVLELLKKPKQTVCILANNHIMDFGAEAMEKTVATIEKRGMKATGAGRHADEASRPAIVECNGWRIGVLAVTSDEPEVGAIVADDQIPGCGSWRPADQLIQKLVRLKRECDLAVVSFHWGREFFEYPSPEQLNVMSRLVQAGADFIVGHHPHVLQGIEQRGQSWIMHSLGHFFVPPFFTTYGREISPRAQSREFALAICEINANNHRKMEIRGGKMDANCRLHFYNNARQQELLSRLQHLAAPFGQNGYEQFWDTYSKKRIRRLRAIKFSEDAHALVRHPLRELNRHRRKLASLQ